MEYNLFWQAVFLLFGGVCTVYHGMKWKETGESRHAFWFGIFIMATIMSIKPFV